MANNKWTDRVRDYKLSPPNNSWQELEAKLPPNKKKRFLFGWWVFLLLSIISALVIWQSDMLKEKKGPAEKTENQSIVKNEENEKTEDKNQLKNSTDSLNSNENIVKSKIENSLDTQNKETSINGFKNDDKNDNLSIKNKPNNKASKKPYAQKSANENEKLLASNSGQEFSLNGSAINQLKSEQNQDVKSLSSENDAIPKNQLSQNESLGNVDDSQNIKEENLAESDLLKESNNTSDSLTLKEPETSKRANDKDSGGSKIMLVPYGNIVLSGSNLNFLEEFQQYGAKQSPQISYGMMLAFKFKDDKARAYLGYEVSNYAFNSKNVFIDSLNQNTVARNINYVSGSSTINSAGQGMQENLQTRLSYHSYSLGMDYRIMNQAKWQIRPYASFALSSLKKQDVYITSENDLKLGELNSVYTSILRLNLGVGFEYQLFPKGKLFVMPNFEYYPNFFYQYSNSIYGFGIKFGVNLRF